MIMLLSEPWATLEELHEHDRKEVFRYEHGEGNYITFQTMAHRFFIINPYLDVELKTLVARCMAKDAEHVPALEDILSQCENAVRDKTHLNIQTKDPRETDEEIRRIVQETMLNADTRPRGEPLPQPNNRVIDALLRNVPANAQMGTTLLGLKPAASVNPNQPARKITGERITAYQKYLYTMRERFGIEITDEQIARAGNLGSS